MEFESNSGLGGLVCLSVLVAAFASYVAFDFARRVPAAAGRSKMIWLAAGALALGIGIWTMHYTGMLAFQVSVPVLYDVPTVCWSLLPPVIASAVALFVAGGTDTRGLLPICLGGISVGLGLAAMHVAGMEAIRIPAECRYSPKLMIVSIGLAMLAPTVALQLTFRGRPGDQHTMFRRKLASAFLMGLAISLAHYSGMAALTVRPVLRQLDLTNFVESTAMTVAVGSASLILVSLLLVALLGESRLAPRLEPPTALGWMRRVIFSLSVWAQSLLLATNRRPAAKTRFWNWFATTCPRFEPRGWLQTGLPLSCSPVTGQSLKFLNGCLRRPSL